MADSDSVSGRRQDTKMSAGEYLCTRISSLKPPMTKIQNPIPLFRMLSAKQWAFFLCALSAWVRPPCLPPPAVFQHATYTHSRPGTRSTSSPCP
ncbi:hypothetical protein IMZ48_31975 [Candidatus Bathyarchaeota archaeon]|nr:hypothetical protein [Candidatus Bathyarchaeota archaeon]